MEVLGPPGLEGSRSVLVHDPFDAEAFEDILPRAAGLRLLLAECGIPEAEDLAFDLFCSFYKYFVRLLPPERIVAECRPHRDLLARALDLREHRKLRALTRLKKEETALATELVLEALLKLMARSPEEPSTEPEPSEPAGAAGASPLEEVTTDRLREVFRGASEDLTVAVELVAAWSTGPGQESRLPSEPKLRVMRDLVRNPRLGQIAHLFARYRRLGLLERQMKGIVASEEVVDFVHGGDVARALAAELSNLASEEREDLFFAKVVTRSLLIYELWRRKREPHPVYLCIDNSGSMAGDKEAWAKAVSLALTHLALGKGRPVDVVLFGDAADPLRVVSLKVEDDGPTRMGKVLDVASYFLGGGTDFVTPLAHVLNVVREGDIHGADLLFVTDGLCPIPEEFATSFREAKARHSIRLTTVIIGGEPYGLAQLSDELHRLEDVLETGEVLAARFGATFLDRRSQSPHLPARSGGKAGRGTPLVFDHFAPEDGRDVPG